MRAGGRDGWQQRCKTNGNHTLTSIASAARLVGNKRSSWCSLGSWARGLGGKLWCAGGMGGGML